MFSIASFNSLRILIFQNVGDQHNISVLFDMDPGCALFANLSESSLGFLLVGFDFCSFSSYLLDEYVSWSVSIITVSENMTSLVHINRHHCLYSFSILHKIAKMMAIVSVNTLCPNRPRSNNSGDLTISLFQASLNRNYSVIYGDDSKLKLLLPTPMPKLFNCLARNPRIERET